MVHAGDMPAIRFGRSYRIPENAVSHLIEQVDTWSVEQAG
jgi:excisionase family DNA binding protein